MAVVSAQDVERFTPERYLVDGAVPAGAPVYLVAGMTWRERARFRAHNAGEGVRYPSDAEVAKAARTAIAELAPDNADELLAKVQAFEDLPPLTIQADVDGSQEVDQTAAADRASVVDAYSAIVDLLRQHPAVGHLISQRVLFNEIVPPMAAAFALRGWEGLSAKFERVNGVVPDRVLDLIPPDDLVAIGNKALALMTVTTAQRGN